MSVLVSIVEGDGEVEALPVLLRKLFFARGRWDVKIGRPKNAHGCGNLTKPGGLEKFVELAFREPGCSAVLVLMDADTDEDCPVKLAQEFATRLKAYGIRHPIGIVFARREYEAWFLASLESIVKNGYSGLLANLVYEGDVEEIKDVKGWLSRKFPGTRIYKETEDQASMTNRIDLNTAYSRSRSFRRLSHAVDELLSAIDTETLIISPKPKN